MNKVNVRIKKLHSDAVIPQYSHLFDSGFDLVAVEDAIIRPGESVKVPTGLAFAIPQGFELQIRDRSGIATKTKLRVSNGPGTVDSGYRGEICVSLDNISVPLFFIRHDGQLAIRSNSRLHTLSKQHDHFHAGNLPAGTYIIRKGDRIAQGVIAPVYQSEFEVVDELDETDRGTGGFGSSGVTA